MMNYTFFIKSEVTVKAATEAEAKQKLVDQLNLGELFDTFRIEDIIQWQEIVKAT